MRDNLMRVNLMRVNLMQDNLTQDNLMGPNLMGHILMEHILMEHNLMEHNLMEHKLMEHNRSSRPSQEASIRCHAIPSKIHPPFTRLPLKVYMRVRRMRRKNMKTKRKRFDGGRTRYNEITIQGISVFIND
jgi:hypothetical protein